jgi:diguanylate cyclase (GGDEF)-like protein/PAS domain S-box-containing protein
MNNLPPEALSAALVRRTRDVLAIVNRDGVLIYASPGAELMLGYPVDELMGSDAFGMVHPDDQLSAIEGFASTSASADSRPTPLLLRLRADGRWIDTEIIATNHLDDPMIDGLLLSIRDVTDSMRTEQSLRESEERYRLIVELAHEGIFVVDNRGNISYANQALARMLETTVADLLGRSIYQFMDTDAGTRAESFARRGTGTSDAHDFQLITAQGSELWTRISANPLRLHDGAHAGIVGLVTDVTERRALEDKLAHDARHDALTGLANRHSLFDALTSALVETKGHVGVLFADLDFFKNVNDSYGHQLGDKILRIAAARIATAARHGDTIARVGGDEFVVVCPRIIERAHAVDVAARIVAAFTDPIHLGSHVITVSVSVGVALTTDDDDADTILARADHALYAAKRAGRNRIEVSLTS